MLIGLGVMIALLGFVAWIIVDLWRSETKAFNQIIAEFEAQERLEQLRRAGL